MPTLLLLLAACLQTSPPKDVSVSDDTAPQLVDQDGDGYNESEDCDDDNAAVNPGATEACTGIDDDCDGAVDEGLDATWFVDGDSDGFGDALTSVEACAAPAGYVADSSDCDDSDGEVFPGAEELCNEVDDDCDGEVDFGMWAMGFGSSTASVAIPHNSALDLGSEGTIELWVYHEGLADNLAFGTLMSKSVNTTGIYFEDKLLTLFQTRVGEETQLRLGTTLLDVDTSRHALNSDREPPAETWIHMAVAWDATGISLYIDGQETTTSAGAPEFLNGTGELYLGSAVRDDLEDGFSPAFIGALNDLRISSTRRYTGDFTPASTLETDGDTQVHYAMRTNTGTTVPDEAGNGAIGARVGASWVEMDCRGDL